MNTRGRLSRAFVATFVGGALFSVVGGAATVAGASAVGGGVTASALPAATASEASGQIMLVAGGPFDGGQGQPVDGARQVDANNWAGYAQHTKQKGTFSAVKDTWKVPKVNTKKRGKQSASDWVGIGGYSEDTLVQVGTSEWNDNGKAGYDAWTEVLPQDVVPIYGVRIRPGDVIKAVVVESKVDIWVMTLSDLTTGKSGGRTVHYRSSGESAEAIHERPDVRGLLATLATTNNVPFNPGSFSKSRPGRPLWRPMLQSISRANLAMIVMVSHKGKEILASPSPPNSTDQGFTVADGPSSPRPPS